MPDAPQPLTLEYAPPEPRAPQDGRAALLAVNWAAAAVGVAMMKHTLHIGTCGVNCPRVPEVMYNGMALLVAVPVLGGCSAYWLWLRGPNLAPGRRRRWRVGLLAPVGLIGLALAATVVTLGLRAG